MRTFIYKRTHKGDPDSQGWFGNEDCMGSLRSCEFDAVVGIGGICELAKVQGISRKLNWIGVGPRKRAQNGKRGPFVAFEHFVLFEDRGIDFSTIAPRLARRLLFAKAARFLFSDGFNRTERAELSRILKLAQDAPPSAERYVGRRRQDGGNCRHCERTRSACVPEQNKYC